MHYFFRIVTTFLDSYKEQSQVLENCRELIKLVNSFINKHENVSEKLVSGKVILIQILYLIEKTVGRNQFHHFSSSGMIKMGIYYLISNLIIKKINKERFLLEKTNFRIIDISHGTIHNFKEFSF